MKYCSSCQQIINLDKAKFCPFCGEKTLSKFDFRDHIPNEGLVYVFEYRNGKKFQEIYKRLKTKEVFFEIGTGKVKYCVVSASIKDAYKLFDCIPSIDTDKTSFIYENGKRCRSSNHIHDSRHCYSLCKVNSNPKEYCFGLHDEHDISNLNIIGCFQIGFGISPFTGVYSYGKWQDVFGNYVFDKEKMKRRAARQIKKYQMCPFLDKEIVYRFIDLWPSEVNAYVDPYWKMWPPKNDAIDREFRDLGLSFGINFERKYKPRFPIVANKNLLRKLIEKLYHNNSVTSTQSTLKDCIDVFQEIVLKKYY